MTETKNLQHLKQKISLSSQNRVSQSLAIKLLRIIGSPFAPATVTSEDDVETLELYDLAVKNKISLLYLETLKRQGRLNRLEAEYDEEYARYAKFLDAFARAVRILNSADIEYAAYKTIRPYPAVPGDIDIVVFGNDSMYTRAIETFLKADYKEAVGDGPSPTRGDLMDLDENVPIDLQKDLQMGYVIYMDKDKFKHQIIKTELPGGEEVNTLTPELDLATVVTHSITEQLYLLGEFYTSLYRLSEMDEGRISRFIDILKDNRITAAARCHFTVAAALCEAAYGVIPPELEKTLVEIGIEQSEVTNLMRSNFKLPHRYGTIPLVKVFLGKMKEGKFRKSVAVQMLRMLNPRLARFVISEIIERCKRGYYIKDYVKNPIRFKP